MSVHSAIFISRNCRHPKKQINLLANMIESPRSEPFLFHLHLTICRTLWNLLESELRGPTRWAGSFLWHFSPCFGSFCDYIPTVLSKI